MRRLWWGILSMIWGDKLARLIDYTGIICFVGPNGSGKSMAAVWSTLPVLDGVEWECGELSHGHHSAFRLHVQRCDVCGPRPIDPRCDLGAEMIAIGSRGFRLIYSTVPLLIDGDEHPRYRPLTDYRQLLTIEHSDVLFDEVAGISDSSDSASMPVQVINWLHKLRKADVRLRVTTPAYSRCSKPIRQACQVVVDCRAFFPERRTSGRLWRPNRAMLFKAFDAFEFEDYTATTGKRVKPLARAAFWRPGHRAAESYDSWGQVLSLGHVTDSGMCMTCGGTRARPKCGCAADADFIPLDELEVVTEDRGASRVKVARRRAVVPSLAVLSEKFEGPAEANG